MLKTVKKVDALSLAKVEALLLGIVYLPLGIFYTWVAPLLGDFFPGMVFGKGGVMGIAYMVVTGVVIGFLGGLVGAVLYNLIVKWVGGVKLDLE